MITVGVIRNGSRYLSHHLRKNDYWVEGEKEVMGEWIGEAAKALSLQGTVEVEAFESLRINRHPQTGKRLTVADSEKRVAFFDIQLSAPKDVSVLAMVGGDERVRQAFNESVNVVLTEMERFAAVRERRGAANETESFRMTGNFAGARFLHDASRDLDPQLHVHAVLANVTWDADRKKWMALQPAEMLRASPYLRQVLFRELAGRLRQLGYETYGMNSKGFSVRGVEHLRERFSKRARQVERLAAEFAERKGRRPTKREVEVLVKESRRNKLNEATTKQVRAMQRAELSREEQNGLDELVRSAQVHGPRVSQSRGETQAVLESALRHLFERKSVAREGEVLAAALELYPAFDDWRELTTALQSHPEIIRRHGEMTLASIRREEAAVTRRAQEGRNTRFALGKSTFLDPKLTAGQKAAARALLENHDSIAALVGDAGTGKTTVLTAIESAHVSSGGERFVPLAPTTRARDALISSGFESADTVQRFLVSEELQRAAAQRLIVVDEAGMLSTQQLDALTRIAGENFSRILLVGDIKQHASVNRGDALRNILHHANLPVVRLSEVLRQRSEADRRYSRLMASGEVIEAFRYAERRGMLEETKDDDVLFARAAEHYADNLAKGVETLVVIPFWDEIERFTQVARAALRKKALLGDQEIVREAVRPLSWSEEQKAHWHQYRPGDRLLFVRNTRFFKRGSSAEVAEILADGILVQGEGGRQMKITRKQRGAFDVGRAQPLAIASGDRILIRSREDSQKFQNGDVAIVARVDPERDEVMLQDGRTLPRNFQAWTYAHAVTSYRSQGSTSEESILVLGEVAERALSQRQFYVGNTRYRGAHRIYVSHREAIMRRLATPDPGRELATEFMHRQRMSRAEEIATRPFRRLGHRARYVWYAMCEQARQMRETVQQKMGV